MPGKTKRGSPASQAQKRASQASSKITKIRARIRREEDARLSRVLKQVSGKGIYEPKSTALTKYRKTRLRKIEREFGELLNKKDFFFVSVPPKQRKEVRQRATGLDFKATRKGIFIPRKGYKKATLLIDEQTGDIDVKTSGRVRRGPRGHTVTTKIIPISSLDEIEKQKERLARAVDNLGPLKDREEIAFRVVEGDSTGFSHTTFRNIEELMSYLELYRQRIGDRWTRDKPSFIHFLTLVEVEKVKSNLDWMREHPPISDAERKKRQRERAKARADSRGRIRVPKGYRVTSKEPIGKRPYTWAK